MNQNEGEQVEKVNPRDVRRAKILSLAAQGIPLADIARQQMISIGTVERAVFSEAGQSQLKECINDIELTINNG